MIKLKTYIIPFLVLNLLCVFQTNAQDHDEHHHAHEEGEHKHDHHLHNNEISLATGIVPLFEDGHKELTIGFHFHYVRGIGKSKRFGLGIGFETIIDEHKHYTFSPVFQYRVFKGLIVGYSPGLMLRQEDDETLYQMAHHIEMTYEFEIGSFHIGPLVEIAKETNGEHYMGGVHFGVEF